METLSENKCFGGVQGVYRHKSQHTKTDMTFGLFIPDGPGPFPFVAFLSGLTCTHENAMVKGGAQAHAAKHGIAVLFPDTSPRGEGVADDEAFDLGQGAGFYVDALEEPWLRHFQMKSYTLGLITEVCGHFPLDWERKAITGHSMGGHGAMTLAASRPDWFRSVSAFSPICNPTESDWGQKQFAAYLGGVKNGSDYDATLLAKAGRLGMPILTDTGTDDQFAPLLKTEALMEALEGRPNATMRMQDGYDHSYFFVSTFMGDHIDFHAKHLSA